MPAAVYEGLGNALKNEGLKVRKVPGWKGRGTGGSHSPRGVMFHHTASNKHSGPRPALGIVTHGRSDLSGPLCNIHVGRDEVITLVAAGQANHAGVGGPERGIPANSGNTYTVGVEVENDGIGEKWSKGLKRALRKLFAVLLRRLGKAVWWLQGHKEWTTRKIDPGGIRMAAFRTSTRLMARRIKGPRKRRR